MPLNRGARRRAPAQDTGGVLRCRESDCPGTQHAQRTSPNQRVPRTTAISQRNGDGNATASKEPNRRFRSGSSPGSALVSGCEPLYIAASVTSQRHEVLFAINIPVFPEIEFHVACESAVMANTAKPAQGAFDSRVVVLGD